jgi:hypothetical protein
MLPFFPEDDPVKDGVIDFVLFSIFVGFLGTTILASYEALPVSLLVRILLCSSLPFPLLA